MMAGFLVIIVTLCVSTNHHTPRLLADVVEDNEMNPVVTVLAGITAFMAVSLMVGAGPSVEVWKHLFIAWLLVGPITSP